MVRTAPFPVTIMTRIRAISHYEWVCRCAPRKSYSKQQPVTSDRNSTVQIDKNRTKSSDELKRKLCRWVLKLSAGSWQMSIGRVFHSRIALGKTVWLYVPVLHWICTSCFEPSGADGTGSRLGCNRYGSETFRIRYIRTLLWTHYWSESDYSVCHRKFCHWYGWAGPK